jgi:hypothetical protein
VTSIRNLDGDRIIQEYEYPPEEGSCYQMALQKPNIPDKLKEVAT